MTQPTQLTHLEHIEDLIITDGIEGCKTAVDILEKVAFKNKSVSIKTKVDGAPSVIAGIDPLTKRFFIGTKSLFNKTPKINFSLADIDRNHGHATGLSRKLKLGLMYFPLTIKDGIYQGDFMFDFDDLAFNEDRTEVSFKPNTIEYRVSDKKMLEEIENSRIGVIWHTKYTCDCPSNLKESSKYLKVEFGGDVSKIKKDPAVWTASTDFVDNYSASKMNRLQIMMFAEGLKTIKDVTSILLPCTDEIFTRDSKISELAMIFINARIRKGQEFINKEETLYEFLSFISNKYQKRIDKLSTDKSKQKLQDEFDSIKKDILLKENWRQTIMVVFEIHSWLQSLKDTVISHLEKASKNDSLKNYIEGEVTGPEGYVVITKNNQAFKFVNRMKFSKANFNIEKGW